LEIFRVIRAIFIKSIVFAPASEVVKPHKKKRNVTFGNEEEITKIKTNERSIRTVYFLKRRKLQTIPRLNEEPLIEAYRGRERRRIEAIYNNVANEIIEKAKKTGSTIVLEKLVNIREHLRYSKEMNGRLHKWSLKNAIHNRI
jgi:putative transposase